jgi:hypothetical protein
VETLLAAVRSGVVLTRADLARAGRELGLGLRQGERRSALDALLAQEPRAVLRWLAGEAGRQAAVHRSAPRAWRPVVAHWAARAEATAAAVGQIRPAARRSAIRASS